MPFLTLLFFFEYTRNAIHLLWHFKSKLRECGFYLASSFPLAPFACFMLLINICIWVLFSVDEVESTYDPRCIFIFRSFLLLLSFHFISFLNDRALVINIMNSIFICASHLQSTWDPFHTTHTLTQHTSQMWHLIESNE